MNKTQLQDAQNGRTSASTVAQSLRDFCKEVTFQRSRDVVSSGTWKLFGPVLGEAASCLEDQGSHSPEKILQKPLADIFRLLRNASAEVSDSEVSDISQPLLVCSVAKLVEHFCNVRALAADDGGVIVLRCGIQVLGNLVSRSEQAKELTWKSTFEERPPLFNTLLRDNDEKVRLYTTMLLYNCLAHPGHCQAFLADMNSTAVIASLASVFTNVDSEWSLYTLELLTQSDHFIHVWPVLDVKTRCIILDVIVDKLEKSEAVNEGLVVPHSLLHCLCEQYRAQLMDIVKTMHPKEVQNDLGPIETTKLLELLCAASIHPSYAAGLKENEPLLEITVDILKTVHFLGKTDTNVFSPVQHLDDLAQAQDGTSDLAKHPTFGLKKNLVRLIGNLCHKSRKVQDSVRSMEGIQLILDVCNLDARNPYIIQWAVLAVRNLLENNLENQAIVAGLVTEGTVVPSPLLQEVGLQFSE